MIPLQDLGEYTLADEELFDVQTITDAMMTTSQSLIELKQDGHADSPMKRILLDHRVKPVRISKYCIAVTLTEPAARSGRFKAKVRQIEKTINHKIDIQ